MISSERSKNIELVLGKLRLPYQLIAKALLAIDVQVLTTAVVDSLDAICPAEDEIRAL